MQIDFNPSRRSTGAALSAEAVVRQDKPSTALSTQTAPNSPSASVPGSPGASQDSTSTVTDTTGLQSKLNQLPDVRSEKVQKVQLELLSQEYPPQVMVDRVAELLAAHFKN